MGDIRGLWRVVDIRGLWRTGGWAILGDSSGGLIHSGNVDTIVANVQ